MVVRRIRNNESDLFKNVINTPDLIWDQNEGVADMSIDADSYDLKRQAALNSAVVILLFTNKRADAADEFLNSFKPADDPQGWAGDTFGESDLGSHLWLLRTQPITPRVLDRFREYAEAALDVLVDQGVVASYEVVVERDLKSRERVNMSVVLYASDGSQKYNRRFENVWEQIYGV